MLRDELLHDALGSRKLVLAGGHRRQIGMLAPFTIGGLAPPSPGPSSASSGLGRRADRGIQCAMSLLVAVSLLAVLTALLGMLNERYLRLQPSIGLMLLALGIGLGLAGIQAAGIADDLGWLQTLLGKLNLSDVLLNGVLCFMVYAGSTGVEFASLERDKWTILTLAIGSTIIACFAIGALLHVALGWMGVTLALSYALVFGALISPTDPIAALAILKAAGLPKRLEAIINGESLFNDGVGVVLFTVFLAFAQGSGQEGSPLVLFLREVLGGVGLGLAVGFVIHFLLLRTNDYGIHLLATLGTVALGYGVALHVDVSGPIAMVVAGLVTGNATVPRLSKDVRAPLTTFWSGIDDLLNSLLFVMMGLLPRSDRDPHSRRRSQRLDQAPDLGRPARRPRARPRPFTTPSP